MTQIAFIGLGTMGAPMAAHLATAGFQVTGYNRSPAKAEQWRRATGQAIVATAADAVADADVVITCVGNDDDLNSLYLGPEGILKRLPAKRLIIDHTTASAQIARRLDEAANAQGHGFIDAPVSGGQQGAEQGTLTIMCGGSETAYQRALPVIKTYAKATNHMGAAGAGQLTKMVNQITVAGLLQGLAEGMAFAEQAGLDLQQVVNVISQGAAQSWQMDHRHHTMIRGEYNHGFAVDWMRKDLAICLEEARTSGAALPVTALVDQFYSDVQRLGGGRWDTSSLLRRLQVAANANK